MSEIVFNGIDGSTGGYLMAPLPPAQVYRLVREEGAHEDQSMRDELRRRVTQAADYGPPAASDPQDLADVGWGVIFASGPDEAASDALAEALRELLDFRKEQAGARYKEFRRDKGHQPGDTHRTFLTRQGIGMGPVDPDRVPYYLLIVGDPETIPYSFQYQLDVQYAVGRIHFEHLEDYARYAHSVVAAERGGAPRQRRLVLAGVANEGDGSTRASATNLVPPLAERLRTAESGWAVDMRVGEQTFKQDLTPLFNSEAPALLFTASHGVAFPSDPQRQLRHQGGLVCQDWPGPFLSHGPMPAEQYISADDVDDQAQLWGSIFFHFACFGAGTPRLDDFSHIRNLTTRQQIAPRAFVAPLPRRMLAHPAGGLLAVIGHVDTAWTHSFEVPLERSNIGTFRDALQMLMRGSRVGFAMEAFNVRFAEVAMSLSEELDDIKFGKVADEMEVSTLWTARNDARSYVVVGDPAARLTFGEGALPPPTPTLRAGTRAGVTATSQEPVARAAPEAGKGLRATLLVVAGPGEAEATGAAIARGAAAHLPAAELRFEGFDVGVGPAIPDTITPRGRAAQGADPLKAVAPLLRYLHNGEALREALLNRLIESQASAVLAQGMGAVICVDLLARQRLPWVKLLITAGSPVALLYTAEALHGLRSGESLPAHFPAWLNLIDPADPLCFLAGPIFAGRATDVELSAGMGYWPASQVWTQIETILRGE